MSYTITVVNKSPITINNGATDTSTSLTLVGKNYPNYGQIIEQNLVNLMQNFAGTSQPTNSVTGQLWWNTTASTLSVYTGSAFKIVGGATVGTSAPTSTAIQGDLWYKSDDAQLYIYNGSNWILIGPSYTTSQQQTTATALNIIDNASAVHTVLAFYVGNTLTGILNKDGAFTPQSPITGFATVQPGYNVNSTVFGGGVPIAGQLITNAQPYVTSLGTLTSLTVSSPIIGSVLYNANTVTYATQSNITSVGTLTGLTTSGAIVPSSNASINIGGASSQYFNNVYAVNFLGTSTTAKYADLAENYLSDKLYEAGTVVEFGGDAEITLGITPFGTNVAGVISTKPAYLMNSSDNELMLPVALQGRVPCKVHGPVKKGDLLVSAGDGCAVAHRDPKNGTIIGKALQSIDYLAIKTIEVVVGVR